MANLRNVRLSAIGEAGSGNQFVEITGEVRFSSREVSENLRYTVRGFLFERDAGRDIWNMRPDGLISRQLERGNPDEDIAEIFNPGGALVITPDGESSRTFTLRREFPLRDTEGGADEYYAAATVVPEIRGDFQISSNEISFTH